MNISKSLFYKLILAAIIFRLFLAAFLYHPDLKTQYFHGQFLTKGVFNIYDYLNINRFNLGYSDTFNYPPLAYVFFGSHYAVSQLLLGNNLDAWINDWSADYLFRPGLFTNLLILKLPYLIFDLLTLYFLTKLITHNQKLITILWLYNPVSWYAIYAIGQFDILPVLATVLTLYFIKNQKFALAGLMLGIGAAFKTYPILLLPALFIVIPKLKDKIISTILGLGIWIIGLLFNGSLGSLQSGLTMRILALGIPVSGSQSILLFPFVYFLALWYLFKNPKNIIWFFFSVTVSVITFSQFHFQWVLWSMPFLTILVFKQRSLIIPAIGFITLAFAHQLLLNDQYSLIALFSPINPYLAGIPSIPNLIKFPLDLVNTFIQTGIFASGIYLIVRSYDVEI